MYNSIRVLIFLKLIDARSKKKYDVYTQKGIWIIHRGTRKIIVYYSTFYGVKSNFRCHTVKCTGAHCNFSSATMNYPNAVFCVYSRTNLDS